MTPSRLTRKPVPKTSTWRRGPLPPVWSWAMPLSSTSGLPVASTATWSGCPDFFPEIPLRCATSRRLVHISERRSPQSGLPSPTVPGDSVFPRVAASGHGYPNCLKPPLFCGGLLIALSENLVPQRQSRSLPPSNRVHARRDAVSHLVACPCSGGLFPLLVAVWLCGCCRWK